jgi:hypothetical protein
LLSASNDSSNLFGICKRSWLSTAPHRAHSATD